MLTARQSLTRHPRPPAAHPDPELLQAIMATADPVQPPTEDEILSLILGELPHIRSRKTRP